MIIHDLDGETIAAISQKLAHPSWIEVMEAIAARRVNQFCNWGGYSQT